MGTIGGMSPQETATLCFLIRHFIKDTLILQAGCTSNGKSFIPESGY